MSQENENKELETADKGITVEDLKGIFDGLGKSIANEVKTVISEMKPKAEDNLDKIEKAQKNEPVVDKKDLVNKALKAELKKIYGSGQQNVVKILTEETSGDGIALVPTEMANQISTLVEKFGIMARDAFNFNFGSKSITVPSLDTNPSGSWKDEATQKSVENAVFGTTTFTRHTYVLLQTLTNELVEDSAFDLVGYLSQRAAEKIAYAEDVAGFTGTGSPITGITSGSLCTSVALGHTLANAITGSTSVLYSKMATAVGSIADVAGINPKWYMNRTVFGDLLSMITSTGAPVVSYNGGTPTVLGSEIVTTPALPSTATTTDGTKYIVYSDLNKAVWVGRRKGITIAVTDSATIGGSSMFEYNAIGVRIEDAKDIHVMQPTLAVVIKSGS